MAFSAHRSVSRAHTARDAVAQLAGDLAARDLRGIVAFCSPRYDLDELGAAFASEFDCPVTACTASQQIGPEGAAVDTIAAAGLYGDVSLTPHLISPLDRAMRGAVDTADAIRRAGPPIDNRRRFGLLLINGDSALEERLAAALYQSLDAVPFIGGTPSGTPLHPRSMVYHDGRFLADAAVFTLVETDAPFRPLIFSNTESTDTMLVCTAADPDSRRIFELNGKPAARAYADAIGRRANELDDEAFSLHPLMLRIGGRDYVRAVRAAHPDHSLSCWCAVEEGLVMRVGRAVGDPVAMANEEIAGIIRAVGPLKLVLGLHSTMRRLALLQAGHTRTVDEMYRRLNVLGCATRGEQFNAIHTSQTLVGMALG